MSSSNSDKGNGEDKRRRSAAGSGLPNLRLYEVLVPGREHLQLLFSQGPQNFQATEPEFVYEFLVAQFSEDEVVFGPFDGPFRVGKNAAPCERSANTDIAQKGSARSGVTLPEFLSALAYRLCAVRGSKYLINVRALIFVAH